MELLTADRAIELLTEVVEEFGEDYVYPRNGSEEPRACDYVRDGKPSCIVAQVVYRAGVPLEVLRSWDTEWEGEGGWAASMALETQPVTRQAIILLSIAQELQDKGVRWGDVLDSVVAEHNKRV